MRSEQSGENQERESLTSSILSSMELKTTEELEEIWRRNNRTEWTNDAFDVVRKILLERTKAVPEQAEPIITITEIPGLQDMILEWLRGHIRGVLVALITLLLIASVGVILYSESQVLPSLPSLPRTLEKFRPSAQNWQPDAYLTNVSYGIAGREASQVLAEYHSVNAPNEILFLKLGRSGIINISALEEPSSSSGAQQTINEHDWTIDAQEALKIFARDKEVETCLLKPSGATIDLSLNRVFTDDAAWVLEIIDCPSRDFLLYIDAKIGQRVDP
jgi:hypothetical protein